MLYHVSEVRWDDAGSKVSKYFTVRHALWLPKWSRIATRDDGVTEDAKAALLRLFNVLDGVQDFLKSKILVHVAYRSEEYNALVRGTAESAHMARKLPDGALIAAVDFHADIPNKVGGDACDVVRARILPVLQSFELRMENNPGSDWVHLDSRPVLTGGHRYFKP